MTLTKAINNDFLYPFTRLRHDDLKFGKYTLSGQNIVFSANTLDLAKVYDVNPGDTLKIKITGNTFLYNYVFLKSDGSVISGFKPTVSGTVILDVVVPLESTQVAIHSNLNPIIETYVIRKAPAVHNKSLNPWYAKNIVVFGTSIPAGGYIGLNNIQSYPYALAELAKATVINEAIGSSSVCSRKVSLVNADTNPYGFIPNFEAASRCLGNTITEMQWIANWINYKLNGGTYANAGAFDTNVFTVNVPASWNSANTDAILSFSYENKLVANHLGDNRKDLYLFEHGHNDYTNSDNYGVIPTDPYDRFYYVGAMNFLINLILTDNPHARIALISHYENQQTPGIVQGQQTVADYWSIPICRLDNLLGWSQRQITTTGYWGSDGYWRDSGGASQTLTIKQTWLADDLHPNTDKSNRANLFIANNIASWLNSFR